MSAGPDASVPLPLLGPSALAQRARAALDDAAAKQMPMLIIAEDGSRPEAVAMALHARTTPGEPFVSVIVDRREGNDRRQGKAAPEGEKRETRDRRRGRIPGTFPDITEG